MFRYQPRKYSKQLLNMGIVKIGTLHDFRRNEHRKGIGDSNEGKKDVLWEIKNVFVNKSSDPNAKKLRSWGMAIEDGAQVVINGLITKRSIDHPDCFVFCFSEKRSQLVMKEFEGADACLEIIDLKHFFESLTEILNDFTPVVFQGHFPVKYQSRIEPWNHRDWGNSPALIKEPRFAGQYEHRAIWMPASVSDIQPLIVGDHRLTSFCREVSV